MANPLQILDLKPDGFQFIQELTVNAPPKRVWRAVLNFPGWFHFDRDHPNWPKVTVQPRVGGLFMMKSRDGKTSSLHGMITHIEQEKLLRMSGPMGLTHLPVNSVFIWELQPQNDGKTTLLRFGQRTFGFIDPELKQRMQGGWSKLLPQLKALAEGAPAKKRAKAKA